MCIYSSVDRRLLRSSFFTDFKTFYHILTSLNLGCILKINVIARIIWASLVAQMVENPAVQGTYVPSLGQEDPLEKRMAIHSNIIPGEFHGQRSPAGYSTWDPKESDMTE